MHTRPPLLLSLLASLLVPALAQAQPSATCPDGPSTASYRVTFTSAWSETTHPTDFPDNDHFSPLVGGTHHAGVSFWDEGQLASPGIDEMARRGQVTPLDTEIQAAITAGTAYNVFTGSGLNAYPASTMLDFDASSAFPLVTLVSMIAPSPDWFVGVTGLPLAQSGTWRSSVMVDLIPYDAGTDDGVTFTSPNAMTVPPQPIAEITSGPLVTNNTQPHLAVFTFAHQNTWPCAANDAATAQLGVPITLYVLSNDTDADADALTLTGLPSQPDQGSASISAGSKSIEYTPPASGSGSTSFSYTVEDGNGGTATATVSVTLVEGLQADVRVFLQGPYHTGPMSMSTALHPDVPGNHPYAAAPWNHAGPESAPAALAAHPDIVDWVLVQLRSGNPAGAMTAEATQAGLLKADGTITGLDGIGPLRFDGVDPGSYFVVVWHRNHLGVMSAAEVDFTDGSGTYDFTDGLSKAYGTAPMKALGSGLYGLFAADANADGHVTALDFNRYNLETTSGASGYNAGDFNLDGEVTALDFNLYNANTTAGASSRVPPLP